MPSRSLAMITPRTSSPSHSSRRVSTTWAYPHCSGPDCCLGDAIDGREPNAAAVLSYKFWHTHFLGDTRVVGKKIELDHKPLLDRRVARPRFTWYSADLWIPLRITNDDSRRFIIDIFLKPGVTNAAANSALQPVVQQFARTAPKQFPERFKVSVEGLNEWVTRSISGTLYLLFGAVILLLAIGCGNVSILLLARGTAHQHELGVRSALGANRGRLVRQLLTESLLLSSLGAMVGILLTFGILAGIKAVLPRYAFAPEVVVSLNVPVLILQCCGRVLDRRFLRLVACSAFIPRGRRVCATIRHTSNRRKH